MNGDIRNRNCTAKVRQSSVSPEPIQSDRRVDPKFQPPAPLSEFCSVLRRWERPLSARRGSHEAVTAAFPGAHVRQLVSSCHWTGPQQRMPVKTILFVANSLPDEEQRGEMPIFRESFSLSLSLTEMSTLLPRDKVWRRNHRNWFSDRLLPLTMGLGNTRKTWTKTLRRHWRQEEMLRDKKDGRVFSPSVGKLYPGRGRCCWCQDFSMSVLKLGSSCVTGCRVWKPKYDVGQHNRLPIKLTAFSKCQNYLTISVEIARKHFLDEESRKGCQGAFRKFK